MSAHRLYDIWIVRIRELLPSERVTRQRNLVWMIIGMYLGQSVHLSQIACKLPFRTKLTSITHRFRRFLDNPAFQPRRWYRAVARPLLTLAASSGIVRLIVDASKVSASHQLLMVALAYRKRALPIAWTWVKGARGHSTTAKQLALLRYVHTLVPTGVPVLILGDCEFGAVAVARQVACWHWHYVLRQQGNTQVCVSSTALALHDFAALVTRRNVIVWHAQAIFTIRHLYHASLLGYWKTGEHAPWLLMTNLPTARAALRAYRRRMWIEEMFGDWKGHGVETERTHLHHVQRLSRLIFVVALLYLWLMTRGAQTVKSGERHLVDRSDRRDLSIFRIGLYTIARRCALGRRFAIRFTPCF